MACEHVMWGIICDSCRVELLLFSLGREKIMGILQPDFLVVNFPTKYFGGGVVGEAGRRIESSIFKSTELRLFFFL